MGQANKPRSYSLESIARPMKVRKKLKRYRRKLAEKAARSRSRKIGTLQSVISRALDADEPMDYLRNQANVDNDRTRLAANRLVRAVEKTG